MEKTLPEPMPEKKLAGIAALNSVLHVKNKGDWTFDFSWVLVLLSLQRIYVILRRQFASFGTQPISFSYSQTSG